ncbi:MAG TPA: hypothetical protein VFM01_06135 [Nakamurella sp.]|nr:hypothetical protein [Nakamurella sp.]
MPRPTPRAVVATTPRCRRIGGNVEVRRGAAVPREPAPRPAVLRDVPPRGRAELPEPLDVREAERVDPDAVLLRDVLDDRGRDDVLVFPAMATRLFPKVTSVPQATPGHVPGRVCRPTPGG